VTFDRPLTVLQVTPNLEIGGAQENLRTMARYLPAAGVHAVVCTFDDGPLRPEIAAMGVPVEILPGRRHSVLALPAFVLEALRTRRELIALVQRHGVDAVQTYGLGTLDFLVATLRLTRRVQVWWTIENVRFMVRREHLGRHGWLLRPKRAAHRCLYRIGARLVNGIIVVSDEAVSAFRDSVGYRGDKIHVVPNAADLERHSEKVDREALRAQLGFRPTDHVMTMVGTFKRQKGHAVLVAALDAVAVRMPHLHVVLVGAGDLSADIRAQVDAAGLTSRVHFLGSRRDVPALLAASDSFVLPSLWEGLSVALVEAMASSLPVIATAVSGTRQVMIDQVTGLLVPPGDAGALAHAVLDLVSDPARASAMGAAGRRRVVAEFGAAGQADQLAALFRGPAGAGIAQPTHAGAIGAVAP
jgi:glycosyltransferase involved in cell wall biosynthesis